MKRMLWLVAVVVSGNALAEAPCVPGQGQGNCNLITHNLDSIPPPPSPAPPVMDMNAEMSPQRRIEFRCQLQGNVLRQALDMLNWGRDPDVVYSEVYQQAVAMGTRFEFRQKLAGDIMTMYHDTHRPTDAMAYYRIYVQQCMVLEDQARP